MGKFTAGKEAKASWIDPRTGDSASAGIFPNRGVQTFATPEGWEDALLVLEPVNGDGAGSAPAEEPAAHLH
jgi:hypothetical protein